MYWLLCFEERHLCIDPCAVDCVHKLKVGEQAVVVMGYQVVNGVVQLLHCFLVGVGRHSDPPSDCRWYDKKEINNTGRISTCNPYYSIQTIQSQVSVRSLAVVSWRFVLSSMVLALWVASLQKVYRFACLIGRMVCA